MIADLAQLHQHAHDAKEVALGKHSFRPVLIDILIVEQSLPSRQVALHDMLNLLGQLLFYVSLHSAQNEWTEDRLQLLDDSQVETLVLVH